MMFEWGHITKVIIKVIILWKWDECRHFSAMINSFNKFWRISLLIISFSPKISFHSVLFFSKALFDLKKWSLSLLRGSVYSGTLQNNYNK